MSPYGIPKEKGGESSENVGKMHACVKAVKGRGVEEGRAIAICKSKLGFTTHGEHKERERTKPKRGPVAT